MLSFCVLLFALLFVVVVVVLLMCLCLHYCMYVLLCSCIYRVYCACSRTSAGYMVWKLLGIHCRGVQWEGGAVDGGSITE